MGGPVLALQNCAWTLGAKGWASTTSKSTASGRMPALRHSRLSYHMVKGLFYSIEALHILQDPVKVLSALSQLGMGLSRGGIGRHRSTCLLHSLVHAPFDRGAQVGLRQHWCLGAAHLLCSLLAQALHLPMYGQHIHVHVQLAGRLPRREELP